MNNGLRLRYVSWNVFDDIDYCRWIATKKGTREMSQLDEDFEEWAPFLLHLVEVNQLKKENEQLRNQIKHLESQVYGGTTK